MSLRSWLFRWVFVVLSFLLVSCTSGGSPTPTPSSSSNPGRLFFPFIIEVHMLNGDKDSLLDLSTSPSVTLGSTLKLVGNNFGSEPGKVVVISRADPQRKLAINGNENILSWKDGEVVFKLPTKDGAGNVLLSTEPIMGNDIVSVLRADGIQNPTNSDFQGTSRLITLQLTSVGIARVSIDKGGDFAGKSLEYKVLLGSGASQQTVATFATLFSSDKAPGDLEKLFNLPARNDYQVIATLFSGPTTVFQQQTVATGDIVVQSSPVPLQVMPGDTISVALPLPCSGYFICFAASASPTPSGTAQPTLAPGQTPAPTPVPTATPTPVPTATPPPGVTPETVASFGNITTLGGKGVTKSTPSSRSFSCTGSDIGQPWSVALDSQKTVHFAMIFGALAKVTSATSCDAIILNEPVAGLRPSILQTFAFAASNDDLYLTDTQLSGTSRWRVVEVKKAAGTYDLAGASNLTFGGITLEAPTSVHEYKSKLYITSSDEEATGGGQSYVIEFDLTTKQSRIVAGTGQPGYSGDGGAATSARVSASDTGFGPQGTPLEDLMVIADTGTNSLRAVNLKTSGNIDFHGQIIAPGAIETIVGKNSDRYIDLTMAPNDGLGFSNYAYRSHDKKQGGFSGDNGTAADARISWPFAPRFDKQARLYFADADNHRIRVVDKQGIMHTVVGATNTITNSGCRGFGSSGGKNIDKATRQYTIPNGDGGDADKSDINHPMDMAVSDNGDGSIDLYIAETDSYRIRKVAGLRWQ